eukprot:7542278-Prorocentrum_lima.AAC.1
MAIKPSAACAQKIYTTRNSKLTQRPRPPARCVWAKTERTITIEGVRVEWSGVEWKWSGVERSGAEVER